MRKLRVGVWLLPNYPKGWGGAYYYYQEMINEISRYSFQNADIVYLSDEPIETSLRPLKHLSPSPTSQTPTFFKWIIDNLFSRFRKLLPSNRTPQLTMCSRSDELIAVCDVIYYLIPMCKFPDFPYIYTLWDIGHLNSYNIPSLSGSDLLEKRTFTYEVLPSKALMVLCESETGKNEAVHYLRLNKERIRIMPLFPSAVVNKNVEAQKPKGLEDDDIFIHYPAQFWAHKNHYNLLIALKEVLESYPNLKLVLTGSDQGNKSYVLDCIKEIGLERSVIDLGFVSLEELSWIYKYSKGLVMPTLLGPTNMPPVEAMELGCPVAISDMAGHREQLGDYPFYFDPLRPTSIVAAIVTMLGSQKKISTAIAPTAERNMKLLDEIFQEVAALRHTWR